MAVLHGETGDVMLVYNKEMLQQEEQDSYAVALTRVAWELIGQLQLRTCGSAYGCITIQLTGVRVQHYTFQLGYRSV